VTGVIGEGGILEVRKGLLPEEVVVVSAQFMLDSESKTQEAIQKMIRTKMASSKEAEPKETPAIKREEERAHEAAQVEVKNLNLTPEKKAEFAQEVYTCPMEEHSHILQVGAGKCPECGMDLVPITQTQRDVYTCPMQEHHHVLSNVPGKCPECSMDLTKLESRAQANQEKRSR